MQGASEYARLFTTGQYGRLYITSGRHARGRTFHIFVLPKGEEAKPGGGNNPPLNRDAVEVYGIVGGHPGWTERYGWLREGPWQDDFQKLVDNAKEKRLRHALELEQKRDARAQAEADRVEKLLADY